MSPWLWLGLALGVPVGALLVWGWPVIRDMALRPLDLVSPQPPESPVPAPIPERLSPYTATYTATSPWVRPLPETSSVAWPVESPVTGVSARGARWYVAEGPIAPDAPTYAYTYTPGDRWPDDPDPYEGDPDTWPTVAEDPDLAQDRALIAELLARRGPYPDPPPTPTP